jgi:hypothetical protein
VGSRGRKLEGRKGRYQRKEREEVIRRVLKEWGKESYKQQKERKGVLKKEMKDFQKEEGRDVEVLKEGRMAMEE